MEIAELVLDFVKVLVWPLVVTFFLIAFSTEIRRKIATLREATVPGGSVRFDSEARQIEQEVEAAAERQDAAAPASHADDIVTEAPVPPAEPAPEAPGDHQALFRALSAAVNVLGDPPTFTAARDIVPTSPPAGVMLAYAELERVARAALTVGRMAPPSKNATLNRAIDMLTRQDGLDPEFAKSARDLSTLRNRVVHGDGHDEVSVSGAFSYVGACETLAQALVSNAISKLRHPSRSKTVREWADWVERSSGTDGSLQ